MGKFCLKVSVIIPAYNAENTISAVIEDLLRQNFLNMDRQIIRLRLYGLLMKNTFVS